MSTDSQRPLVNGQTNGHVNGRTIKSGQTVEELNSELGAAAKDYRAEFHGDQLIGDKQIVPTGTWLDIRDVMTWSNAKQIWEVLSKMMTGQGLDVSTLRCDPLEVTYIGSDASSSDYHTDGIRLAACGLSTREQRKQGYFHPEPSHCKIQQDVTPATHLPG